MWLCLALLEAFCAFSPQFPDQIFADGAEQMHLSIDRPDITWSLVSAPNNDAAFVTSSTYLVDGKVSTPTRIQWDSGSQSIFTGARIVGSTSKTLSVGQTIVFATLCPKTAYALPVDAVVSGTLISAHASIGFTSNNVIKLFNNDAVGAFFVYTMTQSDITALNGSVASSATITQFWVGLETFKYPSGSIWVSPSQTIDIGEIWFGTLQEFKNAADPQYGFVDPTTNRRSHNNNAWPLYGKPYRTLTLALTPRTDSEAYSGTNNWDYTRNQLAAADAVLVIPRLYVRGTTTQDADAINQLTIFGRPDSIGALVGVRDATGYWTVPGVTISEAPP